MRSYTLFVIYWEFDEILVVYDSHISFCSPIYRGLEDKTASLIMLNIDHRRPDQKVKFHAKLSLEMAIFLCL